MVATIVSCTCSMWHLCTAVLCDTECHVLLAQVYLHLYASDRQGVLAAAIASDVRSYSPLMFPEAATSKGEATYPCFL